MELVVTHDACDFDALASAVAALKVYPGAQVVLGRRLGRDVAAYLSLHKDRFPTLGVDDVDAELADRVIMVDVRRASRLGHLPRLRDRMLAKAPALEVHVWDHHGAAEDDIAADFARVEPVGSVTTLFMEEIRRRALAVDPAEATLFAAGNHVDTGSLLYSGTTARDVSALGWLLTRGARLDVVNRYVHLPFTDGQRSALAALLAVVRIERIGGARIGIAEVPEGHRVEGLDAVTTEALALGDFHVLIASFASSDGVQIVARSRAPRLNVSGALRAVGGGGHPTAGAATIRHGNAEAAIVSMLAALRAEAPRPLRVREFKSVLAHKARSIREYAQRCSNGLIVCLESNPVNLPISSGVTIFLRLLCFDAGPSRPA